MAKKSTKRVAKYAPAAWQWNPESLTQATTRDGVLLPTNVQWWSAGGSCSVIPLSKARALVEARAAFCGSAGHICQVHENIDGVNA